jgi:RHS repeat-associated protein
VFARRLTFSQIEWNANGKIKSIERTPSSTKSDLEFVYDASGNRIIKIVKPRDGSGVKSELHWTYTYYVRDASGNVMAVYNRTFEFVSGTDYKDKLNCSELHIYGSKRVGTSNVDSLLTFDFSDATFTDNYDNVFGAGSYDPITPTTPCTTTCKTNYRRKLGKKQYEVTNHLGNVLATVSDRRLSEDNYSYTASGSGNYKYDAARNMYYAVTAGTGTHNRVTSSSDNKTDWYTADVISYSDYFAYGAQQDGRFGGQYRYSFNGKETDAESDLQDYGMRIYNASLGKFLSVDPLTTVYPMLTPYQFASNRPIDGIDLDGLEWKVVTKWYDPSGEYLYTTVRILTQDLISGYATTSLHHAYIGSGAPVEGANDQYWLENKYIPGEMHPSTDYDYTSVESMAQKSNDDAEYIFNGIKGNTFSRAYDIFFRDFCALDNQGTVDDVTMGIFSVVGNFPNSYSTAGRNYADDLLAIESKGPGNSNISSGTAQDAMEIGKRWTGSGPDLHFFKMNNGIGWANGNRAFRLQWKANEKICKANFTESGTFWDAHNATYTPDIQECSYGHN